MTAPAAGTRDYEMWMQGMLDEAEAEARDGGLTVDHREIRDVLESLAQLNPQWPQHRLAGAVAGIFCAGQPLCERLRIAWRILR